MPTPGRLLRAVTLFMAIALVLQASGAAIGADPKSIKDCKVQFDATERTSLQNNSFCLRRLHGDSVKYSTDTGAFTIDVTQTGEGQDAQLTFIMASHNVSLNTEAHMSTKTHALFEISLDQSKDIPSDVPNKYAPSHEDGFFQLIGLDSCRHVSMKGMSIKTINDIKAWTA